jgi:hypothetical protein
VVTVGDARTQLFDQLVLCCLKYLSSSVAPVKLAAAASLAAVRPRLRNTRTLLKPLLNVKDRIGIPVEFQGPYEPPFEC